MDPSSVNERGRGLPSAVRLLLTFSALFLCSLLFERDISDRRGVSSVSELLGLVTHLGRQVLCVEPACTARAVQRIFSSCWL